MPKICWNAEALSILQKHHKLEPYPTREEIEKIAEEIKKFVPNQPAIDKNFERKLENWFKNERMRKKKAKKLQSNKTENSKNEEEFRPKLEPKFEPKFQPKFEPKCELKFEPKIHSTLLRPNVSRTPTF